MMIAKNQGGTNAQTSFGVFTILLGALMIVDVLVGGLVREYFSTGTVEYAAAGVFMIVVLGDLIKQSDPGGRLLRSYSRHGLWSLI